MGGAADDQQVCGSNQLRRGICDGDTLHIGVRVDVPNAVADCLGDFVSVAEHALVHDGDLHFSPPRPPWSSQQPNACGPVFRNEALLRSDFPGMLLLVAAAEYQARDNFGLGARFAKSPWTSPP